MVGSSIYHVGLQIAHATEFLATGTAVRRLTDEHRLPETSPKPTFTLGLDS